MNSASSNRTEQPFAQSDRFTLFIDGKCPLCAREAAWMKRRDKSNGLGFVDIAAVDFDPGVYGKSQSDFMGSIHGLTAEGEMVTGVEVFRRAYSAMGLGWLVVPTRLPVLKQASEAMYVVFAKLRPFLQRKNRCDTNSCNLD
jgi:predicted DCC family thiol-disulfide oxidoreductase YuxK